MANRHSKIWDNKSCIKDKTWPALELSENIIFLYSMYFSVKTRMCVYISTKLMASFTLLSTLCCCFFHLFAVCTYLSLWVLIYIFLHQRKGNMINTLAVNSTPVAPHHCFRSIQCQCGLVICPQCSRICLACNQLVCAQCIASGMQHCKRCCCAYIHNLRYRMWHDHWRACIYTVASACVNIRGNTTVTTSMLYASMGIERTYHAQEYSLTSLLLLLV